MAFTLKRWTGAVLAGMALIAAWRLTSEPASRPGPEPLPPALERQRDLRREVGSLRRTLQQVRWVDSLAPLVAERAENGLAVALPVEADELAEGLDADLAAAEALLERFRRAVRVDADALGPRRPDMLVGYVYQPAKHGVEPGTPYPRPRNETYAGTIDGTDYCLQVHGVYERQVAEDLMGDVERSEAARSGWAEPGRILGPCGFYARHGVPGPHVRSWLEHGAVAMATEPEEDPYVVVDSETGSIFGAVPLERRAAFGVRLHGIRPMRIEACLSGDADACASAFLDPAALFPARFTHEPGLAMRNFDRGWAPFVGLRGVLYELEAEHGREAFGRFWRSDLPVREAFESAFGTEPGPWVLTRVDRRMGVEATGPGLPRSAALGGLLAIGLLAAVATATQARRSLG